MRKLQILSQTFIVLTLIVSADALARGGFGGGGGDFHGGFQGNGAFHGDNGGFHDNNGYNYHGYDNNNFHGDYNNVNVGDDGAVVVGAPVDVYDSNNCQSNQVCNAYGQCWSEDQCD